MPQIAFRPVWGAILFFAFPAVSSSGFFDDLKNNVKGAFQKPPECTEDAKPLPTRHLATISTGVAIYNGPGKRCGQNLQTIANTPVTITGEYSDWYYFETKDKHGQQVHAWVPKARIALSQPIRSNVSKTPTQAASSYPGELVSEVQLLLNDKGYKAGPVDGIFGRGTREAVIEFQRDAGLEATGKLDADTLTSLRNMGANKSASVMADKNQESSINVHEERITGMQNSGEQIKEGVPNHVDDNGGAADVSVNQGTASTIIEYNTRDILVKSKGEAVVIIEKLDNGADFAELAKEESIGPSGPSGGKMGWFNPENMSKSYSDATAKLDKGGYTKEPVETPYGWYVILLEDSRKSTNYVTSQNVHDLKIAELQKTEVIHSDNKSGTSIEPKTVNAVGENEIIVKQGNTPTNQSNHNLDVKMEIAANCGQSRIAATMFVNDDFDISNQDKVMTILRMGADALKKKCKSGWAILRIFPLSKYEILMSGGPGNEWGKHWVQTTYSLSAAEINPNNIDNREQMRRESEAKKAEEERQKKDDELNRRNSLAGFLSSSNAHQLFDGESLAANPFVHEGEIGALESIFISMISKNAAVFTTMNGKEAFIVQNVPTTRFAKEEKVLLACRVKGKEMHKVLSDNPILITVVEYINTYSRSKYQKSDLQWATNELSGE